MKIGNWVLFGRRWRHTIGSLVEDMANRWWTHGDGQRALVVGLSHLERKNLASALFSVALQAADDPQRRRATFCESPYAS